MPWFAMYIAAKSKPHCFGCDLQLCYMSSQIGVDFMRWMMEHGHFWNQQQVIFVLSFKARKSIRLPMKVCHNMHCRTSPCQRDSINFDQFLRTFLPEKGSTVTNVPSLVLLRLHLQWIHRATVPGLLRCDFWGLCLCHAVPTRTAQPGHLARIGDLLGRGKGAVGVFRFPINEHGASLGARNWVSQPK